MGAYGRRKCFPAARFWDFGRILGFRRFTDFGYISAEWAGLGWAGLAGFSKIPSFGRLFSAKDWFFVVCGLGRVRFYAAGGFLLRSLISDLRIYGLDSGILMYLGGIGIGIPCFASTGFDDDDDRRRRH